MLSILLSIYWAPSAATDACVDYGDYTSVQAPDFDAMTAETRVILGPQSTDYIASQVAEYVFVQKICDESDGCNFVCSAIAACYSSIFECLSHTGCNVECDDQLSCGQMVVRASDNQQQMHIECNEKDSCADMEIIISDAQSAHIHCKQTSACEDMVIHLTNTPETSVTCYEEEACTNLQIISDQYTHTILRMYAYSSHIMFDSESGFDDDMINCDLQSRFIQYTYGDNNLESLIRAEYGSNMLPCEDIAVKCGNNDGNLGFCDMGYVMKPASVFDALPREIGSKFEGSTCVNIALYDVMSLGCDGNCLP